MPNQQERARLAGAGALLEKPLDPLSLLHTIRTVLARSEPLRVARLTVIVAQAGVQPRRKQSERNVARSRWMTLVRDNPQARGDT